MSSHPPLTADNMINDDFSYRVFTTHANVRVADGHPSMRAVTTLKMFWLSHRKTETM